MAKKKRFKPIITRVKLNPEQAVLSCSCYDTFFNSSSSFSSFSHTTFYCSVGFSKGHGEGSGYQSYGFGTTSS